MTKCSCGYRNKDKCNKENGSNNGKMCLKGNLSTSRIPKIKWRVERDMHGSLWHTIIAEVDLGSARYREMHSITRQEIDAFRNGGGVLWGIIEKMQWNMLDALGYYDFDSPVSYDLERMQASVDSGTIVVPSGLTRDERREWIRKNKGEQQ